MGEVIFLYVTAPGEAAITAMADTLVTEGLAACVNILPRIRSVYRWKGAIERSEEAAMIVKTTEALADKARRRLEHLHPYETPVIAAFSVVAARSGGGFLNWMACELSETIS
ncbi:MAG TPA: divalent-cation tolerance protein CutA [Parvularcula sp.]|nr:divalent-cation tolerance protein CutA [Parvularcula sp.]HBS31585.1 divalent-cation tolerance protein CutA [Parvularcula sp.]HBS34171.1 divalent-cation tolerance protein CutA [Parvularcula sp.]